MDGITQSAAAVNAGLARLGRTAANLAQAPVSPDGMEVDLAKEIVDLKTTESFTLANLAALRAQDRMLGALLDLQA